MIEGSADLLLKYQDLDASATFFQTYDWYKICSEYLNAQIIVFEFQFEKHSAVLPLLKTKRILSPVYFAPFGTYTGILSKDVLEIKELNFICDHLISKNLNAVLSPFSNNQISLKNQRLDFIQVIELDKLNPTDLMINWEEGQRRRVRVARKKGMEVKQADSEHELKEYYEIYKASIARWGSKRTSYYRFELLMGIWSKFKGTNKMKLWLAYADNQIVGGYLSFYKGIHTIPWHGATRQEFFTHGVSQILMYSMIEYAKKKSFKFFDLTSSHGLQGVIDFKKRLGTEKRDIYVIQNSVGINKKLKNIKSWFAGKDGSSSP